MLLRFDEADDLTDRFMYGPNVDQVLAGEEVTGTSAAGDVLWALTDHLGTVRDLAEYDSGTDTTTIVNHLAYDAFGNVTSETNSAVDFLFGFTGRERDGESDLQYNRARYLGADVGRWISEDPLGFDAGDGNLSRYVGNSVNRNGDPSGLEPPIVNPNDPHFLRQFRDYTITTFNKRTKKFHTKEITIEFNAWVEEGTGKVFERGARFTKKYDGFISPPFLPTVPIPFTGASVGLSGTRELGVTTASSYSEETQTNVLEMHYIVVETMQVGAKAVKGVPLSDPHISRDHSIDEMHNYADQYDVGDHRVELDGTHWRYGEVVAKGVVKFDASMVNKCPDPDMDLPPDNQIIDWEGWPMVEVPLKKDGSLDY